MSQHLQYTKVGPWFLSPVKNVYFYLLACLINSDLFQDPFGKVIVLPRKLDISASTSTDFLIIRHLQARRRNALKGMNLSMHDSIRKMSKCPTLLLYSWEDVKVLWERTSWHAGRIVYVECGCRLPVRSLAGSREFDWGLVGLKRPLILKFRKDFPCLRKQAKKAVSETFKRKFVKLRRTI